MPASVPNTEYTAVIKKINILLSQSTVGWGETNITKQTNTFMVINCGKIYKVMNRVISERQ